MTALRTALATAALVISIVLPSAAVGATVVPPGNSAATQYTEVFPTSGGNAVSNDAISGGHTKPSPSRVLGHQNATTLQRHGQVGREVAELAAETAPPRVSGTSGAHAATGGSQGHGPSHGGRGRSGTVDRTTDGASGPTAAEGTGASGARAGDRRTAATQTPARPGSDLADVGEGSSGIGQVVGQATGASTGSLGLLLPLILVGALFWAAALTWRRKNSAAH